MGRSVGLACGRAALGPEATMISNGSGSLPLSRRHFSISQAASFSVIPGWIRAAMCFMAVSAMKAALRMQEISSSSLTARSRIDDPLRGHQLHSGLLRLFGQAAELRYRDHVGLKSDLARPVAAGESCSVNLRDELLTVTTAKSEASCLACSKWMKSVASTALSRESSSVAAGPLEPVKPLM